MSYNVIDAAKDVLTGKAEYVDDITYRARMDACDNCPHKRKTIGVCGQCGCLLMTKCKFARSECPIGTWKAV